MRAAFLAVVAAIVIPYGYHEVDAHHLFAPADPYGPCPAGSQYIARWVPDSYYSQMTGVPGSQPPVAGNGVVRWMGWTEIATCGASVTVSGG